MLAVRFAETDPDRLEERERWLAAHRAHLRGGGVAVLQSGPLASPDGGPAGGLLVAEVDSLDALRRFSDADPFVVHGVYGRIRILRWDRTIG